MSSKEMIDAVRELLSVSSRLQLAIAALLDALREQNAAATTPIVASAAPTTPIVASEATEGAGGDNFGFIEEAASSDDDISSHRKRARKDDSQ